MLIHGWCYMPFTGGEEIGKVRSVEQISQVKSVQQSVWLQSECISENLYYVD